MVQCIYRHGADTTRSNEMNSLISNIKEKMNEKIQLLNQLEMWSCVESQGIDVNEVASFGFDPLLVPEEEFLVLQKKNRELIYKMNETEISKNYFSRNNPYGWEPQEESGVLKIKPKIFNYVKMKNGEKVSLKKAIPSPTN